MTPLQACDKITHVHLMIFMSTKTQRKSIEGHSTSVSVHIAKYLRSLGKSLLQLSEKNDVSWEFSKNSVCNGGMKCLVGKQAH